MPTCCDCTKELPRASFAKSQLKKSADKRRCLCCCSKIPPVGQHVHGEHDSNDVHTSSSATTGDAESAKMSSDGENSKQSDTSAGRGHGHHDRDGCCVKLCCSCNDDGESTKDDDDEEEEEAAVLNSSIDQASARSLAKEIAEVEAELSRLEEVHDTCISYKGLSVHVEVLRERLRARRVVDNFLERRAQLPVDDPDVDEDCPICLNRLPYEKDHYLQGTGEADNLDSWVFPVRLACCGKLICKDCSDALNKRSVDFQMAQIAALNDPESTTRVDEEQNVGKYCPCCREEFVSREDEIVMRRNRQQASNGVPWANFELGMKYEFADDQNALGSGYRGYTGISSDFAEAARFYTLAAEKGHTGAQYRLGMLYKHGSGVEQSSVEARRLLKLAADKGELGAQGAYAEFLCPVGDEPPSEGEENEYLEYLTLAAARGLARSQGALGLELMMENAHERAEYWLVRAAKQNLPGAQYALAETILFLEEKIFGQVVGAPGFSSVPLVCRLVKMAKEGDEQCYVESPSLEECLLQVSSCCHECGKRRVDCPKKTLYTCSKCNGGYYCSKECQRKHWHDGHKFDCKQEIATFYERLRRRMEK